MTDISIRISGRAGRITLTRPQALNAMTYDMCLAIEDAFDAWQHDPNVDLIILDAEGDRAFARAVTSPNFTPRAPRATTPTGASSGRMNTG
ncbi:hypothetical protein Sulfitobl28_16630 [Sulfitobacter pontiacus]|nr:hypothetical protein Sulfitobl28_16630 [Sulfitobacter pontiacus]